MKLGEVLNRTTQFFRDKNIPSARLDAELLLARALGLKNRVEIYLKFDQPMSDQELARCRELVRRRSLHEPIAYILEAKEFYRSTFKVGPGVLIPRPETETLVEIVVAQLKDKNSEVRGMDIGTGSGCIAASLLLEFPSLKMQAIEQSAKAANYARSNFEALSVQDRVQLINENFADVPLMDASLDFVVANPPYISLSDAEVEDAVKDFEPKEALFAENDGMDLIFRWSLKSAAALKPGGFLAFEIGHKQGDAVKKYLFDLHIFQKVEIMKDLSGKNRFLFANKMENGHG